MTLLDAAIAAWAGLAAGFSLVALWRLRRRHPAPSAEAWPPVLLLRPVEGPSPQELAALGTRIDYPGEVDHLVLSPWRPALPPGPRWLPSDPLTANRKVGHLLYGTGVHAGRPHVVVVADGDVEVNGELLKALVAPVAAGADLCWAPPLPAAPRSWWGRAVRGLLARGHHAFDALQAMQAGAPTLCGKAVALGPRAVELLPEVADRLGEDLELSILLSGRGGRVQVAAVPAPVLADRGVEASAVQRFTRWMQVLRAHRPGLFPTVPLLFTPTWPLLVGAVLAPSAWTLGAVAWLVLVRVLLSARLAARSGQGLEGAAWEWLLGEGLLLWAFASSLARRTVAWRGRTFELGPGGRLLPVTGRPAPWGAT